MEPFSRSDRGGRDVWTRGHIAGRVDPTDPEEILATARRLIGPPVIKVGKVQDEFRFLDELEIGSGLMPHQRERRLQLAREIIGRYTPRTSLRKEHAGG